MSQSYHDLHDSFLGPANVGALNKRLFETLKPGGVLLVIDHAAEAGSGLRDTETLHRIDPARMKTEIEAAGFVLESQSDALRNSGDDHTFRCACGHVKHQAGSMGPVNAKPTEL